jgi:hypothetical protein
MTIDPTLITPWEQTKWIALSSMFFIIPAIYGICNNIRYYSALLFITSAVSANYWRDAKPSWRRDLDLVTAKIAVITGLYNGIVYITSPSHLTIFVSGISGIFYCYHLSNHLHARNNPNWWKYHFAFHVLLTCEQFLVFYTMIMGRQIPQHRI